MLSSQLVSTNHESIPNSITNSLLGDKNFCERVVKFSPLESRDPLPTVERSESNNKNKLQLRRIAVNNPTLATELSGLLLKEQYISRDEVARLVQNGLDTSSSTTNPKLLGGAGGGKCSLNKTKSVLSAVGKVGAVLAEAGAASVPGGEGVIVLFQYAFNEYNNHKKALSQNEEFVKMVGDRFQEVKRMLEVLQEAEFPDNYMPIDEVVRLLLSLAETSQKWSGMSSSKKKYSWCSTGNANSVNITHQFEQQLEALEKLVQNLVSAVTVQSYKGNAELKARLESLKASMEHQNRTLEAVSDNCDEIRSSLLRMEEEQRASEQRIEDMVQRATQGLVGINDENMSELKRYFRVIQAGIGHDQDVMTKVLLQVQQQLKQQPDLSDIGSVLENAQESINDAISKHMSLIDEKFNVIKEQLNALNKQSTSGVKGHIASEMITFADMVEVGGGGQSKVFLASLRVNAEVTAVALKQLPSDPIKNKQAMKELEILRSLSHSNIVHCFGLSFFNHTSYIVLGYCALGSFDFLLQVFSYNGEETAKTPLDIPKLRNLVGHLRYIFPTPKSPRARGAAEDDASDIRSLLVEARSLLSRLLGGSIGCGTETDGVVNVFHDICSAVRYIHSINIIHGDLKSANILLDEKGIPRVTDFGISGNAGGSGQLTTGSSRLATGTVGFCSPEQTEGIKLTPATDVYSLGMVVYSLITGGIPFDHLQCASVDAVVIAIATGKCPKLPPSTRPELKKLLHQMWSKNPRQRPNIFTIKDMFSGSKLNKDLKFDPFFSSLSSFDSQASLSDEIVELVGNLQIIDESAKVRFQEYLCDELGCTTVEEVRDEIDDERVKAILPPAKFSKLKRQLKALDQTIDEEVTPTSPSNKVNGSISKQASLSDEIVEWVETLSIIDEETINRLLDCLCVELGCTTIDEVREVMREEKEYVERVKAILPPAKQIKFNRLLVKDNVSTQETIPMTKASSKSSPVQLQTTSETLTPSDQLEEAIENEDDELCERLQPWVEAYEQLVEVKERCAQARKNRDFKLSRELRAQIDSFPKTLDAFEQQTKSAQEKQAKAVEQANKKAEAEAKKKAEAAEQAKKKAEAEAQAKKKAEADAQAKKKAEAEASERAAEEALVSSQEEREAKALADSGTINKIMSNDRTPLTDAAYNKLDMVKALLKFGADVNAKGRYGGTALMGACDNNSVEIVRVLLAVEGIDVNAKSDGGYTALILACRNNSVEVVRALLAVEGIDVNAKDITGRTALSYARAIGKPELEALLRSAGAR